MEELQRRLQTVLSAVVVAETTRSNMLDEEKHHLAKKQAATEARTMLTQAGDVIRKVHDIMMSDRLTSLEAMVTQGLQSIFGPHLSLEILTAIKYGKVSAEPLLVSNTPNCGVIKGPPLEAFGGGPSSIVGLLFRTICLLRSKQCRFLLLDETVAAVSDEYLEGTAQFLSRLAQMCGVTILLVTHKSAFLEFADKSYRGATSERGTFHVSKTPTGS